MTTSTRQAIRAEIHKIVSVRGLLAFPVLAVAYVPLGFLPALTASAEERRLMRGDELLEVVRGPGFVVAVAMLLLGILAVGSEFRHRTISSTLGVTPNRIRLAISKAVAVGIVGAVTAAGVEVLALSLGLLFLASNGIVSTVSVAAVISSMAAAVAVIVLYALAGVGLAFVVRDQTLATGAALVWILVVEGVIPVILRQEWLFKWMPSGAANAVLGVADPPPDLLPAWVGGLILLSVAVVLTSAGAMAFATRDVE